MSRCRRRPAASSAATAPSAKALGNIGQALQSGDLTSAQQAFASLPVGLVPPNAVSTNVHRHHGHAQLQQSLDQLGQALQSGNLTAAQQAFTALQQSWQATSSSGAATAQTNAGMATTLNISA